MRKWVLLIILVSFVGNAMAVSPNEQESDNMNPVVFFDVWDLVEGDIDPNISAFYQKKGLFEEETMVVWVSGTILSPMPSEKDEYYIWGGSHIIVSSVPVGVRIFDNLKQQAIDNIIRYDEMQDEHRRYCNYQYGYWATRIAFPITVDKSIYGEDDLEKILQGLSVSIPLMGWDGKNDASRTVAANIAEIRGREWNTSLFKIQAVSLEKKMSEPILHYSDEEIDWNYGFIYEPYINPTTLTEGKTQWTLEWKYEGPWKPGFMMIRCDEEYRSIFESFRSYRIDFSDKSSITIRMDPSETGKEFERETILQLLHEANISVLVSPEAFSADGPYYKIAFDLGEL